MTGQHKQHHPKPWKRKVKTAEELYALVESYFTKCREENRAPTTSGLAVHCGYSSRQTFDEAAAIDEDYKLIITQAKARISDHLEGQASSGKGGSGLTLMLHNFGWKPANVIMQQDIRQETTFRDQTPLEKAILIAKIRGQLELAGVVTGAKAAIEADDQEDEEESWL